MSLNDGDAGGIEVAPRPFFKQLAERPGARRILSNTVWLGADRLSRLGVGLFLTGWVARYLGPDRFGLLNYAIALVYLFSVLGGLGLDSIVIRSFVREPEAKDRLLCTTFLVKLAGGTLSLFLLIAMLFWMHSDRMTIWLVGIIGFGTVVQATDVVDYWFQSQVKSKWSAIPRNAAFFSMALFRVSLLLRHASILWFGVAALLEIVVAGAGMVFILFRLGDAPRAWMPDLGLARKLLGQSWPLLLSGVSVMVYVRIDQIMLDRMAGGAAVGLYSAAVRISELCYFVPTIIASSVLPSIVRARTMGTAIYMARIQKYFDLSAIMAVAIALPTSLAAGWVTRLLYGAQYTGVSTILTVHIWATIFVFMGVARGQYLLSEGHFIFSMTATGLGAICNIILNLFWIPRYGALGPALATVVSYGCSDLVSSFFYKHTWKAGIMQLKALFFPGSLARLLRDRQL
jgi:PST family polysaccharide transporter